MNVSFRMLLLLVKCIFFGWSGACECGFGSLSLAYFSSTQNKYYTHKCEIVHIHKHNS